ncbi:MAG: transporter [Aeoliella sp.]
MLAIFLALASNSYGEPFLEFMDDFGKPAHCHRDSMEERIETERHDFTQSTTTVGRGVVQVEAGYSYFYKDEHGEIEETHATPEMLWRIGLSEDIELRLRWNYGWRLVDDVEEKNGAQDLTWSLKLGMTEQDCGLPESALEIRSTAPTGGNSWSTDRVEFGLDYIYGWQLTESLTLTGSTGFGTDGLGDFSLVPDDPAGDRFTVWSQSAALGKELSERTTMYAEYFGIFSHARSEDISLNFFNIGIDYYLTHNWVIDVRAGVGLSPDSEDFFGGVGGAYRF